jgi:hypothetical protein
VRGNSPAGDCLGCGLNGLQDVTSSRITAKLIGPTTFTYTEFFITIIGGTLLLFDELLITIYRDICQNV